jgi:hypothetical protein
MSGETDYQGIALVIAAVGVAVPSIIAAIVSLMNLNRGNVRDEKMAQIHDLVNGQSLKINAMSEAKGFREGMDQERANPTPPK